MIDSKIRHSSGRWPCGCDDTDGVVTKLEDVDGEPMAFVGTPCFWQWFPVGELVDERVGK